MWECCNDRSQHLPSNHFRLLFVELSTRMKCLLDTCSICSFRNSPIYGTCITYISYQQTFQCHTAVSKATSREWKLGPCPEISSLTFALTIAACHVTDAIQFTQLPQSWYIQSTAQFLPCLAMRSASMMGHPRSAKAPDTVDFPLAMPPVTAKRCITVIDYFLFCPYIRKTS